MSKLQYFLPILAELFLPRNLARKPEPDLIMDREDQVEAYLDSGDAKGEMFVLHLFHAAHMLQTVFGARRIVDLGCGPGTQLLLMSRLCPEAQFVGVDLSAAMLDAAERTFRVHGVRNVTLMRHDIAAPSCTGLGEFDAVTSTMAAHHLPDVGRLEQFFSNISVLSRSNGAVYVADLLRPKRCYTAEFMALASSDVQDKVFNEDYLNSMRAAFQSSDYRMMKAKYFPQCEYYTTRPIRLFAVMKTAARPVSNIAAAAVSLECSALSSRQRHDLSDLRQFFALGGLKSAGVLRLDRPSLPRRPG